MAKKLSKALRTDLNQMAALLRSKGRNGDTILAHINPEEAALLKARGGSGKANPHTGLPEFQEEFSMFGGDAPSYEPFQQIDYSAFDEGPSAADYAAGTAQPGLTATEISEAVGPDLSQYFYPGETGFTYDDYPSAAQYAAGTALPSQPYGGLTVQDQAAIGALPTVEGAQPVAPGVVSPPQKAPGEKGFLESAEELARKYPKTAGTLESILGTAGKIGLGALGSIPIQRTQRSAAQQSAQLGKEIGALGAPQKAIGTQMLAQAEAGQLTPQQQQSLAATRAQQKQALARAGVTSGTAAQQAEANAQRLAQTYVSQNIDTALKMIQFGDRYVAQGIKAGYDANQQANQAANIFYQNMFGLLGGTGNILRG